MKVYSITIGLFLLFFVAMGAKVVDLAPESAACEVTNCIEQIKQNPQLCNELDSKAIKLWKLAKVCNKEA